MFTHFNLVTSFPPSSPDVNLLSRGQRLGPEAWDLPGHVGVHHVVGQTDNLHVEHLLEAAVEARVTDDPEPDERLVCDVTVVRSLRHSCEQGLQLLGRELISA